MKLLWFLPALAALYALHRLAPWAKSRGWIYYRETRGGGVLRGIVQDLQTHLQPRIEQVRKAQQEPREGRREEVGSGGPGPRS